MDAKLILGYFFPFIPLTFQKIKISNKWKKNPRDIIILHTCAKNHDQMIYGSWDMLRNGQVEGWKKWHTEMGARPKKSLKWIRKFKTV